MASPRIRRLQLDHTSLQARFANWPPIQITGTAGMPPEVYRITYALKGLYVNSGGEIHARETHVMEINLSLDYPRRAPQCRMLTPVFHPNFDEASVCIGDFWAASEGLDDLIIRIGRMIAYQEYNTRSPLNGLAARWAAEHPQLLPLDARAVAPPLVAAVQVSVEPVRLPSHVLDDGAENQQPEYLAAVGLHHADHPRHEQDGQQHEANEPAKDGDDHDHRNRKGADG